MTEEPPWNGQGKVYWLQWNRLILKDDMFNRTWVYEATGIDRFELVVQIIRMFHTAPGAGHVVVKRTLGRIQLRAH